MSPADRGRAAGAVPLASLSDGRCARLVTVEGGAAFRTRLVAMGLRPGAELRVVHNGGRGPFVLAIDDCRMVLGRGMAHRVLVMPVKEHAPSAK